MNKNGIYANLPDELKEKLKSCRTEEEMTALLKAAQFELPDELLETVSGGEDPLRFSCNSFANECDGYEQPQCQNFTGADSAFF